MNNSRINCSNPKSQFISDANEIADAVNRVLYSDEYILGHEVSSFESEFSAFIGSEFCVAVNSGTDAIVLALRALDIQAGDEIITTSHTAVATISAICAVGAIPVFVDIDPEYFTMATYKIRKLVTTKTKAVIAVHIYGHPCDMDELSQFSIEQGIYLIEDCAQAHGAKWRDKNVGTFGIISCFSFYPTKNLGAIGDGGAVLTSNVILAERLKRLREYGWDSNRISVELGMVSRLDEIQAAILRVKLKKLRASNIARRNIAVRYASDINNPKVTLPKEHYLAYHVYHLFVIKVMDRELFMKMLNKVGIYPGIHYAVPAHKHPAFSTISSFRNFDLETTESISTQILSLPIYPELKIDDLDRIILEINRIK